MCLQEEGNMAIHASNPTTASSELLNTLRGILGTLHGDGNGDGAILRDALTQVNNLEAQMVCIMELFEDRKLLEQAKTVLMLRGRLTEDAAHTRIQKAAVEAKVKSCVICRQIISVEALMHSGSKKKKH
jgi:hypothetical protein